MRGTSGGQSVCDLLTDRCMLCCCDPAGPGTIAKKRTAQQQQSGPKSLSGLLKPFQLVKMGGSSASLEALNSRLQEAHASYSNARAAAKAAAAVVGTLPMGHA